MKILLVAYDMAAQRSLKRALAKGTCRGDWADRYDEVGPRLDATPYDAVLIEADDDEDDAASPRLPELLSALTNRRTRPLIVVTAAHSTRVTCPDARNLGADACYLSPFTFADVLRHTIELHRARAPRNGSAGTLFSITLDPVERALREGPRWLSLSKHEFLILERLLREPNRPVQRSALIDYASRRAGTAGDAGHFASAHQVAEAGLSLPHRYDQPRRLSIDRLVDRGTVVCRSTVH